MEPPHSSGRGQAWLGSVTSIVHPTNKRSHPLPPMPLPKLHSPATKSSSFLQDPRSPHPPSRMGQGTATLCWGVTGQVLPVPSQISITVKKLSPTPPLPSPLKLFSPFLPPSPPLSTCIKADCVCVCSCTHMCILNWFCQDPENIPPKPYFFFLSRKWGLKET